MHSQVSSSLHIYPRFQIADVFSITLYIKKWRTSFLFHDYDAKGGKAVDNVPIGLVTLADNARVNVMATSLLALTASPKG